MGGPQVIADDADRAQAHAEWLEEFRAQHRRKHVLRASDYCVDCGELIEASRLKALPTAERCLYYQSEHEHIERRYGYAHLIQRPVHKKQRKPSQHGAVARRIKTEPAINSNND